jgi:serine/threonine protein kinase
MQPISASYVSEQIIGTGGFATVYRARHLIAPINIAIKMIDTNTFKTYVQHTKLVREVTILKQINHPFIAKLFFTDQQDNICFIGQEYVQRGSLFDLVSHYGPIPEIKVRRYFCQLVCALEYLHTVCKVAHRDLKLENILIDEHDNVKIIDFGLSCQFIEGTRLTTPCGSYPYVAPKIITTGCYTHSSDIWSLGLVLYGLATGLLPFTMDDMSTICHQIETKSIYYPSYLPCEMIDLLSKMLCRDPERRITIEQIKSHPWFIVDKYMSMIHALNLVNELGFDRINTTVIQNMIADGLDCSQLYEYLETGEENDMTILYKIYLRQEQNKWMKLILDESTIWQSLVRERKSLPVIRCSNIITRTRLWNSVKQTCPRVENETESSDQKKTTDSILTTRRLFRPEVISIRSRIPQSPIFRFDKIPQFIGIIHKTPR